MKSSRIPVSIIIAVIEAISFRTIARARNHIRA